MSIDYGRDAPPCGNEEHVTREDRRREAGLKDQHDAKRRREQEHEVIMAHAATLVPPGLRHDLAIEEHKRLMYALEYAKANGEYGSLRDIANRIQGVRRD